RVEGFARRGETADAADRLGVADRVSTELESVVADAELVILCTPVEHMRTVLEPVLGALRRGAIVTDVGSVKLQVVRELEPMVSGAGLHFIGSHPMAGGERIGVNRARADLFDHAVCAITPTPQSNDPAIERVAGFWEGLGMRLLRLTPELHDELVSRASHLPHLVASALAGYVLDPEFPGEQRDLCAGGFRDATRIASGPVAMWRGILSANRENLVRDIDGLTARLNDLRAALADNDPQTIEELLKQAHDRREHWLSGDTIFRTHGPA
ncbi:MAG TPA: prephenate dehydrogenase/arogenate dehydrogenase family protein, partial [Verrucomicrobiales bacterium]|nr:prephenate dehydrogenase/arogenate dehydrogenase family protein [Verrucomicrobiales bacterium]